MVIFRMFRTLLFFNDIHENQCAIVRSYKMNNGGVELSSNTTILHLWGCICGGACVGVHLWGCICGSACVGVHVWGCMCGGACG